MIKRLINRLIDRLIPKLLDEFLNFRFDVHRISSNVFQFTIYYDSMVVFTQIINLNKPNP